jgi:hypothetical protein
MKTSTLRSVAIAALLLAACSGPAGAQNFDYGDAPEGALAYPATGQLGQFPTCLFSGQSTYVRHALGAARFYSVPPIPQQGKRDAEADGNAGTCPPPLYDQDECWLDGDAGLLIPTSYTIAGGAVTPCPNVIIPQALGTVCASATITAHVENVMPNATIGFVNVLIDWNQDGRWGGGSPCGGGGSNTPEHAVVDAPIGNPFDAVWTSPSFVVGGVGNSYHWMRLEIANVQVGPGWDGSGDFEDGESEDYLIYVAGDPTATQRESWGRVKTLYR